MKSRLIKTVFAAIVFAACATVTTAREAYTFFVEAPVNVINIFDRNSRLDMLDYFRSGLSTPTGNVIGGKSRVTALNSNLVSANVSDNTKLDLALLPVKGDTIIAIIETVATPIPDSSIRFYTKDWTPLPSPDFPSSIDFVDKKERRKVADSAPLFDFIAVEYLPEKALFRFTNHTAEYYVKPEMPMIFEVADSVITMRYDGKRFVKAK